jgi:hypothetical protein
MYGTSGFGLAGKTDKAKKKRLLTGFCRVTLFAV